MLKLKLFNSKTLSEPKELRLAPENMINGECFIGRSPNCGLVLPSPEVSRVHGSISWKEGEYYFSDLASLSGSRLNDEAVKVNQKYLLKPDDIIRIGAFVLTIQSTQVGAETPEIITSGRVQVATPLEALPELDLPSIPEVDQKSLEPPHPTTSPGSYMPVALIPPDQMNRWMKGDLKVRCVGAIDETHDVKTFRFAADPPVLFTYQPGQFIIVTLEINGRLLKRPYSISSTPSRPHTLEITVKRVPSPTDSPEATPGLVSNWLHDNMKVGSELMVSGPGGQFSCLANPSKKVLMISADSGITPMISMLRWVFDTGADCDIVCFYSARSPRDIIFRQELEWMAARLPKLRLAISVTKLEPGQVWCGFTGRLTEPILQAIAPDFLQRRVYVCGPNAFMAGIKNMLNNLSFPMQNYYEESFGEARNIKQQSSNSTPKAASSSSNPPVQKGSPGSNQVVSKSSSPG